MRVPIMKSMFIFLRSRDSLHEPELLLKTISDKNYANLAISRNFCSKSSKVLTKHLLMFLKKAQNSNSLNLASSVTVLFLYSQCGN